MGSIVNKGKGTVQMPPQQCVPYGQILQQPQFVPPGQSFLQQPQFVPPGQSFLQQPQFVPPDQSVLQQPPQYRPTGLPIQPQSTMRPPYPNAPGMPRYPMPSSGVSASSSYEQDLFLANLTGWPIDDIERLRREFFSYTNPLGVIDREGFRKLYIASLLNMTWDAVERDSEIAFRNFDLNQTGGLDFNEYIMACSRMTRDANPPQPPPNPNVIY
ncbi:unnamed protein product [Rotaria socialis]|uniref:EF-hand domain-containing protein n=1 Tax=Rotaria socialis TaxID=392032 RepID=A0A819VN00_9BILA|nr:unnamed protein product [Rotaria socialis]CAF4111453.1 unnamed protein product [Rotaria socialis]